MSPFSCVFSSNTDKTRYGETSTERLFSDNVLHITQHGKTHTLFTDANGIYSFFLRKSCRARKLFNVIIIVDPLYSVPNWELFLFVFHMRIIPRWVENYQVVRIWLPVSVVARSKAARLLRLWVRIPQGAWMSVCCECCVLSGRGLCDELITHPEESYRLWCVVVCDLESSRMRRPRPAFGRTPQEKKERNLVG